MEAARGQMKEMLRQNVIERSTSAISVPVQLTPKPNTMPLEMRFCLDCRKPNMLIKREIFPLPGMNEFTAWMEYVQPQFFIKLDLKSMYFQLPLEKESRLLTAFNFGHEKFQFTRVVMNMANSVGHSQNIMIKLFSYLDDAALPGSRTNPAFNIMESVREVFKRLRERGLKLNKSKCEIYS